MSSALTNLLAFVAAISILVAVHEFGHYIVGRWAGMKVLRFSIGFGKPIWMRVAGKDSTEYCIASIPLGGYVRFLDSREGPVPPEDEGRAFNQRPIPHRIAVLLAGPAFNFLFAILAYWLLFAGGVTVLKPAIGEIEPGSYAERAGLEFGDKIVAVNDERVLDWEAALVAMLETMVVDGRQYRVSMEVTPQSPTEHSTTLTAVVEWDLLIDPGQPDDTRTARITTIVGRTVELYPN